MAALALRYAALSDLGRYRKDNQDAGYAGDNLLVIADGVGGAAYGDVASHTAIQIMRRLDEPPAGDSLEVLAGAIHRVHDRLAELVEQDSELDGTSTTITAGLFDGTRLGMAHLGDSRAYLLRGGGIRQITKDHTFVQTLIDEGRITEAEARNHPHRNLILRAVDGVHDTEPDLFYVDLEPGDRLLFCSDGCSGVLDDEQLAQVLGNGGVDFTTVELVRNALDLGTTDNVTVVVADVVDAEAPADPDAQAAAGPIVVGAAASQPRKLSGDDPTEPAVQHTGEIAPVGSEEEDVDPEDLRYALRPPRRFTWLRRVALLVVLLAVVGGLGKLAYDWSQDQYYVAEDEGYVAIYRGVDFDLPLLTMHRVHERSAITMEALDEVRADDVREGIAADDLDDARQIVENVRSVAEVCPEPEPEKPRKRNQPAPTPTPTPTIAPPDCITQADAGTTP